MASAPSWWLAAAVAETAARAGGAAALAHFRRSGLNIDTKADDSPVTRADRESEAAIRTCIAAAFPEDDWLGEETGATDSGRVSGRRWIVDPVDGTRNFIRGIPLWSVLIACEEFSAAGSQIVASAVGFPALDEWYSAVRGGGARCGQSPVQVSAISRLADSGMAYYTRAWFTKAGLGPLFDELESATAIHRGGGDAYGHALVASGRMECIVEPGLQVWDAAATSLLVEEAGGRWSDLAGKADLRAGTLVLSNGLVHDQVLAIAARHRSRP
ncbi:histidinol-phosphatase [Planctomycetota bacterium]|nr:histidinol-phosphatase [Planctomycetota bacterium]